MSSTEMRETHEINTGDLIRHVTGSPFTVREIREASHGDGMTFMISTWNFRTHVWTLPFAIPADQGRKWEVITDPRVIKLFPL